jgi:hypothetical protein
VLMGLPMAGDRAPVPTRIGPPATTPSPKPERVQPGVAAFIAAQDN